MSIEQIIREGRELEYIDKLKSYNLSISDSVFNDSMISLLFLCENGRYNIDAQQFIKDIVLNTFYGDTDLGNTKELLKLIENKSVKDYVHTSNLLFRLIADVYDKKITEINDGEEVIVSLENIEKFKNELINSNHTLLKKAIDENVKYENLISVFYSNIKELMPNRQIVLSDPALSSLRAYLKENPVDYALNFIRPYYSGTINNSWADYFLHVPEPFFLQIFKDDLTFDSFLKIALEKGLKEEVAEDLQEFYDLAVNKEEVDGARVVYLNNSLYPFNPEGITLVSGAHKKARLE